MIKKKNTGEERKEGIIKEVKEWKYPGEDNSAVAKTGKNYEKGKNVVSNAAERRGKKKKGHKILWLLGI